MSAAAPIDQPETISAEGEALGTGPRPSRWTGFAARYGLVIVFGVIVALFSILKSDTYPTVATWQAIASTQAVIALLALAALLPLVVGQFDVSLAFQLGLSQALCAGLIIRQHWPAGEAAAAAVASCVAVGLINGLLVTRVRLTSFIATLGVGTLVLGFTELYSNDETISGAFPNWFSNLGQNKLLGLPLPLVYVVVVMVILWLALEYTSWGRECHATGGSPRAALLAGVRTDRVTLECFVFAGLLAGLAGVLSVMTLGASSPVVGLGELLPAYAGAFLGATAIRPGRFNAIGTVLAVYLLAAGITGLQQLGAAFYVQELFNGAALLIALSLAAFVGRRRAAEV